MTASYDDTVAALYQAPHAEFVAERKRLSNELKAGGDKAGAARLAKLPRPSISAWAVNQLWWHARANFDELLAAAELLRRGERQAASAHREALTRLRARAGTLLGAAGHAATEGTLRRVATTLSALAATGGFDPDPPGALSADRDPPGFDAVGLGFALPALAATTDREDTGTPEAKAARGKPKREGVGPSPDAEAAGAEGEAEGGRGRLEEGQARADAEASRKRQAEERTRAEAEASRKRLEEERARAESEANRKRLAEERARAEAERHRLQAALRTAKSELEAHTRDVERLRKQLTAAEQQLARAREAVEKLELRLSSAMPDTSGPARGGEAGPTG